MLFLHFDSQEERRRYGGSAFLELQYCRLPVKTPTKKIIAVRSINNWQNDSLYIYVDDLDIFYQEYSNFFNNGIYNNLNSGLMDICGINYYSPLQTDSIIKKISVDKPRDHEVLVDWLEKAKEYNGFYILGI